jgi:NAD(P)-dependent dehydrogenase (short-subunit alcohol dehydrogenase family)
MKKLNEKVALVTGGSSGIGLATAENFINEGAKTVIITGRNQDALDKAVEKLGKKAVGILCDSTNMADIQKLAAAIKKVTQTLDVVYLNAGMSDFAPVGNISELHYDNVFNTNVKGVIFTAQEVLPLVNDGSSIIFCSSAGVEKGFPGASVYVASKAALSGFVKIWSLELVSRKIRVNSIVPGFVDTPLFDKVGMTEEQKNGAIALYNSKIPMGRFASATEIAKAITFLASDDSSYITGIDLLADGGYKLS